MVGAAVALSERYVSVLGEIDGWEMHRKWFLPEGECIALWVIV